MFSIALSPGLLRGGGGREKEGLVHIACACTAVSVYYAIKDTEEKRTLQKWLRGTWFCVSGTGHISCGNLYTSMFIQYLTNMHNTIIVLFSVGLKAQLKYLLVLT